VKCLYVVCTCEQCTPEFAEMLSEVKRTGRHMKPQVAAGRRYEPHGSIKQQGFGSGSGSGSGSWPSLIPGYMMLQPQWLSHEPQFKASCT
jgi:hypothetical protein